MNWKNVIQKADCRVIKCTATQCVHNENQQCTLPEITLGSKIGICEQFENPKMHSRKVQTPTPGQQSFIDRATRTLNEEKEGRQ